jgi:hypothetical protein
MSLRVRSEKNHWSRREDEHNKAANDPWFFDTALVRHKYRPGTQITDALMILMLSPK